MACGLGACLCCVEKVLSDESLVLSDVTHRMLSDITQQKSLNTKQSTLITEQKSLNTKQSTLNTHNVCVCKEGPVFNIKQLLWQS